MGFPRYCIGYLSFVYNEKGKINMETYKVLKGTKLIEYVTYTVEADSEEDAIQMVKDLMSFM